MARPFSDIRRAEKLMAYLTKLKAYEAKDDATKSSEYAASQNGERNKVALQSAYIAPFGGPANFFLEVGVPKSGVAGASALIPGLATILGTARVQESIAETDSSMKGGRFRAAKIKLVSRSLTTRAATSRFTGRQYKQPNVDTVSSKFGRGTGTETYDAAIQAMQSNANSWAGADATASKRSVFFYPQLDKA